MSEKKYSKLEQHVINIFNSSSKFLYNNSTYVVLQCDKPRPQKSGECKTDVYVKLKNLDTNEISEIKISCKLPSNEFQENKINSNRALNIFGEDWEEILKQANLSIKHKIEEQNVINPKGKGRIKEGFLTIGWKLEITTKERTLSARLPLSNNEIKNSIYRGINQTEDKRNSIINNSIIENSGIASHMLISEIHELHTIDDVLDKIISIDNYDINPHYLVYTGFSHRIKNNKNDGNRPLAVQVKYIANIEDDCLNYCFIFDYPLDTKHSGKNYVELAKKEIEKLSNDYINQFI